MESNKKHNHEQEIMVSGAIFIETLEWISTILHIAAVILSLASLIGMAFAHSEHYHHVKEALEITTLVVIALILILHFTRGPLHRYLVKRMMGNFWGNNKVRSRISYPTGVKLNKDDSFGKLSSHGDIFNNQNIWIGFKREGFLKLKKHLNIKFQMKPTRRWKSLANSDGLIDAYLNPKYIIINVKEKYIKFTAHFKTATGENVTDDKDTIFTINTKDRTAKWSGVFPEHPFYGEWAWDEDTTLGEGFWRRRSYKKQKLKEEKINNKH